MLFHCIIQDLRQDMLTLLSLRLMENVWKSSGLDFGIIPYRVLSTGPMVGLIHVVSKSDTLGRIQKTHGLLGTMREGIIYNWLEKFAHDDNERCGTDFFKNRSVQGLKPLTCIGVKLSSIVNLVELTFFSIYNFYREH